MTQGQSSDYYRRFRRSRVATGRRLVEEGRLVALLDTKDETERAKEIGCLSWKVDLLDEDQVETVCQNVNGVGPVGILVNSAARFVLKGLRPHPMNGRNDMNIRERR